MTRFRVTHCIAAQLVFIALLSATSEGAVVVTMDANQANTIRITQEINSPSLDFYAKASNGTFNGRIEIRYDQTFQFVPLGSPAGWSSQNDQQSNGSENVATFYFLGIEPTNPAERYDITTTPSEFSFLLIKPLGSDETTSTVQITSHSTAFFPPVIFGTEVRMIEPSVDIVPEPSALLSLTLSWLFLAKRRRR